MPFLASLAYAHPLHPHESLWMNALLKATGLVTRRERVHVCNGVAGVTGIESCMAGGAGVQAQAQQSGQQKRQNEGGLRHLGQALRGRHVAFFPSCDGSCSVRGPSLNGF